MLLYQSHKNKTNLNYLGEVWNEKFELRDHILYQIFKIILNMSSKNMKQ